MLRSAVNSLVSPCAKLLTKSTGTHCAGTIGSIAGNNDGVVGINPDPSKFSFYVGKALNANGSGSSSGVIATVDKCVDEGVSSLSCWMIRSACNCLPYLSMI